MPNQKIRVDGLAIDPPRTELNFVSGSYVSVTKTDTAGVATLTFDVTGATTSATGTFATAVHTPIVDAGTAVALAIAPTTATSLDLAGAAILTNVKGDLLMAASKVLGFGAPQALSGVGAVNVTTLATLFTSTGPGQALSMADGTRAGQIKFVMHVVDGGSGVLTPTTKTSFTTLTLTAVYDWGAMMWDGSAWRPLAYGGTAAFA